VASAIGIDIGGTRLRAARILGGKIEARASAASSPDPVQVLARVLDLVAQVRSPDVVALGLGVPGKVQANSRRVLSGGYVDLSGIDFVAEVEAATGLPVVIENDGTMALLGEAAHGVARGHRNVVMLTIGTGIGGAILEQGQVVRGHGTAGELGHLCIDPNGRTCVCGRTGCVETVSSGTAFGTHLTEAGLPASTRVEDLLARNDAVARHVITAWAQPLQTAISTLMAILDPDCVVIGGGAGRAALAALATLPPNRSWYTAPILQAALGDDAGVIGAATAALRAVQG
jgi:glucokinase